MLWKGSRFLLLLAIVTIKFSEGFDIYSILTRNICRVPRRPINGAFKYGRSRFGVPSSTISYSCTSGYELQGSKFNICQNKRWTFSTPRCAVKNNCRQRNPCHYNAICRSFFLSFTCRCKSGYSGDGKRSCSRTCKPPRAVRNLQYSPVKIEYDEFDRITYSCDSGYIAYSGSSSSMCRFGFFSGVSPSCFKMDCSPPVSPLNGNMSPSSRIAWAAGHKVTYTCLEGYVLTGEKSAVCQESGSYSSPRPTCEATCPKPLAPNNGSISPDDKEIWRVDDVVTYVCEKGTAINGAVMATCTSDKVFKPDPPKCEVIITEARSLSASGDGDEGSADPTSLGGTTEGSDL